MSDEPIPRMYGITCPNTKSGVHVYRLGKEIFAPSATDADLQAVLVATYKGINPDTCDECNTAIQFSLDQVRFVDDTEEPLYTEVSPSLN